MADDLSMLPENVCEAVRYGNVVWIEWSDPDQSEMWLTIRTELLRLARENWQLREANAGLYARMERLERAEAELAKLKARIAEAPVVEDFEKAEGVAYVSTDGRLWRKRVRLLVEDEG